MTDRRKWLSKFLIVAILQHAGIPNVLIRGQIFDPFRDDRPVKYRFTPVSGNIWEIQEECLTDGGRLAMIKRESELNAALPVIANNVGPLFLGLLTPQKKPKFRWIDGSHFNERGIVGWQSGEPNGFAGLNGNKNDQRCVEYDHAKKGSKQSLNDVQCTSERQGLCEPGPTFPHSDHEIHGVLFDTKLLYGAIRFKFRKGVLDRIQGQLWVKEPPSEHLVVVMAKKSYPEFCDNAPDFSLMNLYKTESNVIRYQQIWKQGLGHYHPVMIDKMVRNGEEVIDHVIVILGLGSEARKIACGNVIEKRAYTWYKSISEMQFKNTFGVADLF